MKDPDGLHSNEKSKNSSKTNDGKCENDNNCNQFSIEIEEEMDESERERWRRDSKNYEALIDKLFDEDNEDDGDDKSSGDV